MTGGSHVYPNWSLPRFISESHFTGTTTNSGFSIGAPANIQPGDYLFASFVVNKDAITPDSNFTVIRTDADSANPWQMVLYSRVATASDIGATYTWANSAVTPAPATMVIMAFRDVETSQVTTAKTYTAGTTNPVTTPAITNSVPALIVRGNGSRHTTDGIIRTWTGSGNERFDGGNGNLVTYSQAWYDSGSVTYTLASQAGISITVSSTTNMTDRLSYSVCLPAKNLTNWDAGYSAVAVRASLW